MTDTKRMKKTKKMNNNNEVIINVKKTLNTNIKHEKMHEQQHLNRHQRMNLIQSTTIKRMYLKICTRRVIMILRVILTVMAKIRTSSDVKETSDMNQTLEESIMRVDKQPCLIMTLVNYSHKRRQPIAIGNIMRMMNHYL